MTNDIQNKPPLRAVPMSLFDTASNLDDAVEWAKGHLPITSENVLISVLMTYHNTLLKELKETK